MNNTMSQYRYIAEWRAGLPKRLVACGNPLCGKEFETRFGTYCCAVCKAKAHKLKQRAKREVRHCWWCSVELKDPHKLKFCSRQHNWKFDRARKAGRAVQVQVTPTLKIETRKWDRIPEVRQQWLQKINTISA